ncbi:MAG: ribosome small subunit-dependent GTPase A [Xanthomonadales bacterium]
MTQAALVLVSYGGQGMVELDNGERLACKYRRSVGRPYCGDRVEIQRVDGHSAVVSRILPRDNVFVRADARLRKQPIAANLSQALIIIAPRPAPSRDLVERYLVAIHSLGIRPVIVLNKTELLQEKEYDNKTSLGRQADYRQLGYEVLRTSCKTAPGIGSLKAVLEHKTSILVGQSGVGKSSLINSLLPDLELQTGSLSAATGKGIHTTTTTIMYSMPAGGRLIDSPGVWEYGLWRMEPEELADGFVEFQAYLGRCKFNDCHHDHEPQCAIREAAESGALFPWRYQAYLRLLSQSS